MIYFDTDFLVHSIINQDRKRHLLAQKIFDKTHNEQKIFISLLNLQEIAFVCSKLRMQTFEINEILTIFHYFKPINYTFEQYLRACEICQKIGFQNINDCLHTAIAETHYTELYTFNQRDFHQIKNHTTLKINILSN